jgi:hypothetical protein
MQPHATESLFVAKIAHKRWISAANRAWYVNKPGETVFSSSHGLAPGGHGFYSGIHV